MESKNASELLSTFTTSWLSRMPKNIVLKGLRANGMLCWKPVDGKLQRAEVDENLNQHPVGQHRMKHSWLKDRYSWLDEKGRPKTPGWSRSDQAEELADLEEQDYCFKEKQDCEG